MSKNYTKPRPKSPTKPQTPGLVARHKERELKRDEERIAQEEAQKAMELMHAKELDLERLTKMCQPKKVFKKESPLKKPLKAPLSEEQIQKQQDSIARLSKAQVKKKPPTKEV